MPHPAVDDLGRQPTLAAWAVVGHDTGVCPRRAASVPTPDAVAIPTARYIHRSSRRRRPSVSSSRFSMRPSVDRTTAMSCASCRNSALSSVGSGIIAPFDCGERLPSPADRLLSVGQLAAHVVDGLLAVDLDDDHQNGSWTISNDEYVSYDCAPCPPAS